MSVVFLFTLETEFDGTTLLGVAKQDQEAKMHKDVKDIVRIMGWGGEIKRTLLYLGTPAINRKFL